MQETYPSLCTATSIANAKQQAQASETKAATKLFEIVASSLEEERWLWKSWIWEGEGLVRLMRQSERLPEAGKATIPRSELEVTWLPGLFLLPPSLPHSFSLSHSSRTPHKSDLKRKSKNSCGFQWQRQAEGAFNQLPKAANESAEESLKTTPTTRGLKLKH